MIQLDGVTKHFPTIGGQVQALGGVHLDVREGEFVALQGPSGCGKSTGNLDTDSAAALMAAMAEFQHGGGTILLATHDRQLAERADRVVRMAAGRVVAAPERAEQNQGRRLGRKPRSPVSPRPGASLGETRLRETTTGAVC